MEFISNFINNFINIVSGILYQPWCVPLSSNLLWLRFIRKEMLTGQATAVRRSI